MILMWLELGGHPFEPWVLVLIVFLLSFLMVSNIHYLSFKEMGLGKLKSFNWLVAALLLFVLIAIQPQFMGFIMLASYVIGGPFAARIMAKKKAAKAEAPLQAGEQDRLPLS